MFSDEFFNNANLPAAVNREDNDNQHLHNLRTLTTRLATDSSTKQVYKQLYVRTTMKTFSSPRNINNLFRQRQITTSKTNYYIISSMTDRSMVRNCDCSISICTQLSNKINSNYSSSCDIVQHG